MQTTNPPLRWYVLTEVICPICVPTTWSLTGAPPVPPKQMFGLWVSEYGYENWDELTSILDSLQVENFPLDGFVLDLFWFGGVRGDNRWVRWRGMKKIFLTRRSLSLICVPTMAWAL